MFSFKLAAKPTPPWNLTSCDHLLICILLEHDICMHIWTVHEWKKLKAQGWAIANQGDQLEFKHFKENCSDNES